MKDSLFGELSIIGMRGCEEFTAQGFPADAVKGIKDVADCNLYFFENAVPTWVSYTVLIGSIVLLVGAFVLMNVLSARTKTKSEKKVK
jgi:hypothetical protein